MRKPCRGFRILSLTLAWLLAFHGVLLGQQPAQTPAAPKLRIVILEGEGAINNIRQRTARDPVVQVVDENNNPVAGVVVTFLLPNAGPSGAFANGAQSLTILTNSQGIATATGLSPNAVAGELSIRVSASHQGQTANATINQVNAVSGAAAGGVSGATVGILAGIGVAAAVGAALALGGGNGNGGGMTPVPTRTATVTFGAPPTVSGGR